MPVKSKYNPTPEFFQCSICGNFYNPCHLSEVFEHEHRGIETDKEYFGNRIEE